MTKGRGSRLGFHKSSFTTTIFFSVSRGLSSKFWRCELDSRNSAQPSVADCSKNYNAQSYYKSLD